MITLFVDTNVLLSFYHLTSEDIEELKKVIPLIDGNQIELMLPDQVRDEFLRNRGAKIADAMRKLQDAKFNLSFPVFAKSYDGYSELRDLMKKADKAHADLCRRSGKSSLCQSEKHCCKPGALFESSYEGSAGQSAR
jgi:predicted nucleic acid-binding protein